MIALDDYNCNNINITAQLDVAGMKDLLLSLAFMRDIVAGRILPLVDGHRAENVDSDSRFARLVAVLKAVAEEYDLLVVVSTPPRTRTRVEATGAGLHPQEPLTKPLGLTDFVRLETQARGTWPDSGTITEQSSILNFPTLNIQEAHKRPEGMEQAAVMMTGLSVERVLQGLEILASQPRGPERLLLPVADYSVPNVSEKCG
jgi:UDP-N-acetylglucosamine 2-epimerase